MLFFVVVFVLFIGGANSLACTSKTQCLSVSRQLNYVDCDSSSGQCACLNMNGFSGNATPECKCDCVSPSKVFLLDSGSAYCSDIAASVVNANEKLQADYQVAIIKAVYDGLVWPAPRDIMIALITGQPSIIYNYFAENARGRVDPVGTFSTHDGIVEYFYGLTWTGATKITKVQFKKLISQGNIVHSNVVLTFNLYDQTQQHVIFTYNLTQSGSFTFDANKKIASADLIIHNLGEISDKQTPKGPEFINTLCYLILNVAGCNATFDPQGFYADFPDCVQHFNQYEWGSMDNVYFNGNTAICRFFHALLAIGRPHVHCSHSGRTGGGKCQKHDYSSYYTVDYKRRAISAA